ncbi:hypothetical protein [Pontibacter sp. G13]|uniref:hypothetical protein n=1 Tax=Pontibacter sp. G13 TaxID=3074898 RepID=UPI0028892C63|nr:hypothetical protein [Pontibacter sp. G13]WNJ21178.1 hypothetical protein RJD25_11980 [Pontibacter sp. G13]
MDILERIIENLTSDEVRRFKILSNRFKADEEKKLLILFDAIRAGKFKESEEDVIKQFYGSSGAKARNSYYRLRNKLMNNLEKSLLFYHFNYKNSIESYSYIQLAVLFRERGLYRESFYNLRKAERVAEQQDQFQVLEVVYDEMVKLAVHHDVDIESVITKRRENQKHIDILRASSEVLGMVTQSLLKRNFGRSKKSVSVIDTLEGIKQQLEEHKDIFHSTSGKMMILKAVASILIQKSAFQELADYAKKTFDEFNDDGQFNKDNHASRLMLRIWRINSLHKLLKIADASEELEFLGEELQMFKRQNFGEYAFHYYSARLFNLKVSGDLDAYGDLLEEALTLPEIKGNALQEVYMLISMVDLLFCKSLHPQASEVFLQIKAHKGYVQLGEELQFYVQIYELVNLYQGRNYEDAERQHKAFKKSCKKLLKDEFFQREAKFVEIIMRLNAAAIAGKNVFLKSAYRNFVDEFEASEVGGNQIMQFESYLLAMIEERDYYEVFLEAVNGQEM